MPPNSQRHSVRTGVIVALGDAVTSKAFKVGDEVIIAQYAGMEVTVGEKLLLLPTVEIVGKIG